MSQLYFIIFMFFVIGGIGTYFANKGKDTLERRRNWLKYLTYFIIVNILFGTITFCREAFPFVCISVVIFGYFELIGLQRKKKAFQNRGFYLLLLFYTILSVLFCLFSCESQHILLFTLILVCTFDAFCQISGQLAGKRKMCPRLSPGKTYEGLIGGTLISLGTAYFTGRILELPLLHYMILGLGICCFSLGGDLAASWIKRKYEVKDFSSVLPGHGGFLDRFDSLIAAGAFVYIMNNFFIC